VSTKAKISKEISSNTCISIKDSKQFLESFLNLVKSQKSKKIKITNFGTFYYHKSPSRIGRNPKTRESYIIEPMSKLTFKASSKIKEILNY